MDQQTVAKACGPFFITKEASFEMGKTSDRSTAENEKIPDKYAADVKRLLRQQAALATFESFAFRETNLLKILNEAARICAECLNVPFCTVFRYRSKENDLLIEAGCGCGFKRDRACRLTG